MLPFNIAAFLHNFHKQTLKKYLIFSGTNVVAVETDIMDIMGVNDKQFSVTISMYFAVKWDEPRIETNNTVTEGIYIILERWGRGIYPHMSWVMLQIRDFRISTHRISP